MPQWPTFVFFLAQTRRNYHQRAADRVFGFPWPKELRCVGSWWMVFSSDPVSGGKRCLWGEAVSLGGSGVFGKYVSPWLGSGLGCRCGA